ncbi:TRAP transporter small permease [Halocella sp. SP3-1]|uniref:TRAP transporter small permease n=1 Tax=Halocella sp. SP3-1 TaxID=2382161 RepID=UPI000F75F118|nr:TRAP transporter small permease [Halocella sp. SP3-1]AZO94540.1 TRAP transporter small permease [Halocella sp. SP3-1]
MKRLLDSVCYISILLTNFITKMLLSVMVFITFILVISRFIFSYSFPWVEELTRYLMVWLVLLGAAVVLRIDKHISVNFFSDYFSKTLKTILNIIFQLLIIGYLVILTVVGYRAANMMWILKSPSMGFPLFWVYLALPVSSVMMIVYAVNQIIDYVSGLINKSANKGGCEG